MKVMTKVKSGFKFGNFLTGMSIKPNLNQFHSSQKNECLAKYELCQINLLDLKPEFKIKF